jgi:hypothetical protein
MKQDVIKEIRYGLRNSRFLILFSSVLFLAISAPIMNKVFLPMLMKSQLPGITEETLGEILDMTQTGSMRSYMGDLFEIGTIIIVFTLCGLLAQEIRDNTLVLPLCSGKRFHTVIGSKLLVFGCFLILTPLIATLINYLYAGILFSFDIGFTPVLRSGLLLGAYMLFLITCLLFWGAVVRKPIAAGFLTCATIYGITIAGSLLKIDPFLPSGLLKEAQFLAVVPSPTLLQTLAITAGLILILYGATLLRLQKLEWNER